MEDKHMTDASGQRCLASKLLIPHTENCKLCAALRLFWWYLAIKGAFITGLIASEHFR